MKLGATISLLIGLALAWAGMAQEHSGPPGNSPEEECQRSCHVKHCDGYVACIGTADPTLCRLDVNKKEAECLRSCEPPRG